MSYLTRVVKELRERWMMLYMNIHMLRSGDPRAEAVLEPFKLRISLFNEEMMVFLDRLEEPLEVEGK